MNYVLDEQGNPVVEDDILAWAKWYEEATKKRTVHVVRDEIGEVLVSTIFLAVDHNFSGNGSPILWETMILGGEHDHYQERYSSKEAALDGHARAVAMVTDPPAPSGGRREEK